MKLRMILPVIVGGVALSLAAVGVVLLGQGATPVRAQGGQPCILIFPPPPGCEPAPLAVTADQPEYAPGATITASVTNNTSEIAYGGGGYDCGVVNLEIWRGAGWERAPGGAQICTAIAIGVAGGATRQETFTAPPERGWYRLVSELTSDSGARLTGTSNYFAIY